MNVKYIPQENESGDPAVADQGFGRISDWQPPQFDPATQADEAVEFFVENGFAVLADCLSGEELDHLNEHYREFVEKSPFVAVATSGPGGLDC